MPAINASTLKPKLMKSVLNTLYFSQLYRVLKEDWQGVGAIFTLHHVSDGTPRPDFAPNRILDVSASFLDETLSMVRDAGYDIVSLDEAERRLREKDFARRFVAFTLDDGYRDNHEIAYPIFRRHKAPFAIYVATAFPDGKALLWWEVLENILRQQDSVTITLSDQEQRYQTGSTEEKYAAWDAIYKQLRQMPEAQQREAVAALSDQYGVDTEKHCIEQSMSWETLSQLNQDPLVTIGAHTVNHYALAKLSEEAVVDEVSKSRDLLEQRLGERPMHFSYPYGDPGSAAAREFKIIRELGFKTATTTRKAMLYPEHADHLTALPRISLNGDYQSAHYTRLFLSGAPFALSNRFRKIVVD